MLLFKAHLIIVYRQQPFNQSDSRTRPGERLRSIRVDHVNVINLQGVIFQNVLIRLPE